LFPSATTGSSSASSSTETFGSGAATVCLMHSPLASDDFFAAWRAGKTATDVFGRETSLGGPLAFCFVDGAHERGQVERDLRHADEFLVPGGFVLFDDSDEFGAFPHIHDVVQATIRGRRY